MPVVVHERFGRILAGVQDVLRSVCEGRARVPASGPQSCSGGQEPVYGITRVPASGCLSPERPL